MGPDLPPDEAPRYGLDHAWELERRRLSLLEEVFDPATIRRLDACGVGTGAKCLEIGGGAGSVAGWLCRAVGPTGHVTATDLDTRWLQELEEPNLSVLVHDITKDQFAPESFDIIHARAVLEHIATREDVLPRLVEWLVPGGILLLEDAANFPVDAAADPGYGRAWLACSEILARTGTDYRWPATFPDPLKRAGLRDVGADVALPMMRGGSPVAEFWSLTIEFLRPQVVEAGLLADADIDSARAYLADSNFWDLSPAIVGAWGRR